MKKERKIIGIALMTAFRNYYFNISPSSARKGTYTWNGSAWIGPH